MFLCKKLGVLGCVGMAVADAGLFFSSSLVAEERGILKGI
jgi:hypothetical protein